MSSTTKKNETHGKKSVSFQAKDDSPKEEKEAKEEESDLKPEAGGLLRDSKTGVVDGDGGAATTTPGMKKWKTL